MTVYTSNLGNAGERLSDGTTELEVEGVRVVYFHSMWHYHHAAVTPDLIGHCRRELAEFDVINIYGYREFMTLIVATLARKRGIPYVLQPQGNLPRYSRSQTLKFLYDRLFGQRLLQGTERIIAQSLLEAGQFPRFGIPPEKTAVVPNGVDLTEFQRNGGVRGEFRRRYSIAATEPVVLFLGRLARIKTIDLLLEAFSLLSQDARLVLVGPTVEPDYAIELKWLSRRLGIAANTLFTGPLDGQDKLAAYCDADVFVLPSAMETYGLAAAEAIACGTPVIVTEGCGLAPLVNGRVGLVAKHDVTSLQQALDRLLSDEGLHQTFAAQCRQVAEEKLGWEAPVNKMEAILQEVVMGTERQRSR
ncbi:glycosyltransferase [Acidobacteria bacterium AH-259-D05]|nr:glycosyltransferase [Acidobacteria bacterium AH-259-D05]